MLRNLALALVMVGCIRATCSAEQPAVGLILPLSGPSAPFGAVVHRGVNAVDPSTKRFLVEDDQCLPQKAVSAFRSLRGRGVRHFLGPCCTTSMAAVAPIIKSEKLVAMNVCTGAERIWDLSDNRVFHAQMSADEESRQNARMMWNRGIKKVVILYVEHEYALAHERAFKQAFPGEIVQSLSFTGADIGQMKQLVLKLKSLQFDALYIPIVEPFFLGVLTEAAKVHARPPRVFSVFSFQLPEVLVAEGTHADGVIYSYPELPTESPAAEYFASIGTRLFSDAAAQCGEDLDCVRKHLIDSGRFDEHGFLRGKIGWKTVEDGKFVPLPLPRVGG